MPGCRLHSALGYDHLNLAVAIRTLQAGFSALGSNNTKPKLELGLTGLLGA